MTPDKARTHRGEPYSPGYVNNLYRGLKQFYVWRTETEDIDNPMARMKPPKVDDKLVPVPQDDEVAAILKPVERAKDFNSRREHAILRLLLSSGMRLAELHGLTADDFAIKKRAGAGARQGQQGTDGQVRLQDRRRDQPVPAGAHVAQAAERPNPSC